MNMIAGISNLTADQIRRRILSFDSSYVNDWNTWLIVRRDYSLDHVASEFGRILRRWQACRPNTMRRCRYEDAHGAPYLEDLVLRGIEVSSALRDFDLRHAHAINEATEKALLELWTIFKDLSYSGGCRNGLAGVVAISKAVLLLTEGRVGPAFDSKVRKMLRTGDILTAKDWIMNLKNVIQDITQFERLNQCSLSETVPEEYSRFHYGRLYDMIFGPGAGHSA